MLLQVEKHSMAPEPRKKVTQLNDRKRTENGGVLMVWWFTKIKTSTNAALFNRCARCSLGCTTITHTHRSIDEGSNWKGDYSSILVNNMQQRKSLINIISTILCVFFVILYSNSLFVRWFSYRFPPRFSFHVNKVREFVKTSLMVHHNKEGWRAVTNAYTNGLKHAARGAHVAARVFCAVCNAFWEFSNN